MQGPYGSTESVNLSGTKISPVITWDSKSKLEISKKFHRKFLYFSSYHSSGNGWWSLRNELEG